MTNRTSSLDLMPAPFGWIDVPADAVTLNSGGYVPIGGLTFDVPAFTIAKYPVTNAQYAVFIDAGGYEQPRWWTAHGWKHLQSITRRLPTHWHVPPFQLPDHPVVGITWFEAVAFCLWLSDASGEAIMLPTELQWFRAARGDTSWRYPWGDAFDPARCNSSVKTPRKRNSTSPVNRYEGTGDSPFGVVDMCGNVWEWGLTEFYTGQHDPHLVTEDSLVTRPGSAWTLPSARTMEITGRVASFPHAPISYEIGFRIARAALDSPR